MEEKKRVQFIDMVKGITILCVAVYHIIAPGMIHAFLAGIIGSLFFSFFFFSGYFYTPGRKTVAENILARAKSLLVPFFSYSLTFWITGTVILLVNKTATAMDAVCCLRNFYAGAIWNRTIQDFFGWDYHSLGKSYPFLADFWFLPALFLASIVFIILVEKITRTVLSQLVAVAVMLAATAAMVYFSVSLPYNLHMTPFWAAIVLLGNTFKLLKAFDRLEGAWAWILGAAVSAASIGSAVYFQYGTSLFRGTFDEPEIPVMLFLFAVGIGSIWGVSTLCKQVEDLGTVNVGGIAYFGSHSIYLYMYHVFVAWLICCATGFSMRYDPEAVTVDIYEKSLLLSIAAVLISTLISVLAADKAKETKVKQVFKASWEG